MYFGEAKSAIRAVATVLLLISAIGSEALAGEVISASGHASGASLRPTILTRCVTMLGPRSETDLLAACLQSEATLQASDVSGSGRLADFTLAAGICALLGAIIASGVALYVPHVAEDRRERSKRETLRATYFAEISVVLNTLHAHDVRGTLIRHADAGTRFWYHPSEHWLQMYFHDPSSAGVFSQEQARDVVWFYSMMKSQLGRLIYLHNLTDDQIQKTVTMAEVNRIQREICHSLDGLFDRGGRLRDSLGPD